MSMMEMLWILMEEKVYKIKSYELILFEFYFYFYTFEILMIGFYGVLHFKFLHAMYYSLNHYKVLLCIR